MSSATGTSADGEQWWPKASGPKKVSIGLRPPFWHALDGHSTSLSHVSPGTGTETRVEGAGGYKVAIAC